MYIFSLNATARDDKHGFKAGEVLPFIVYIDFKDLFGAEKLAQIFLMREGFGDAHVVKRKHLGEEQLQQPALRNDPQIAEALRSGYAMQVFESH